MAGGPFADLDPQRRDAIAAQLRETGGDGLTYLTRIILQCYYRPGDAVGGHGTEAALSQRLRGGTRRLVPVGSGARAPEALLRRRLTEIGTTAFGALQPMGSDAA
jgi:hypothetical protein